LILGTTSFGKGSIQAVIPLKDGFGIKYTIARYYTPNGNSIQAKGIVPDIDVEYEILVKKDEKISMFDRMIKEKDLKNSLEPENTEEIKNSEKSEKSEKKKNQMYPDNDQLVLDVQVKRALDILISYGVFSKLDGK